LGLNRFCGKIEKGPAGQGVREKSCWAVTDEFKNWLVDFRASEGKKGT